MRLFASSFLLLSLAAGYLLPAPALAQSVPEYLARYGDTPVPVIDESGGRSTQLFLVGRRGDTILFRQSRQGSGTLEMPADTGNLRLRLEYPAAVNQAEQAVEQGDYERATQLLRPLVYPLLPFMDLSPEKINFHPILELHLRALIEGEFFEEAADLMDRLELGRMPGIIVAQAFELAEALSNAGESREALELMNEIPLSAEREEFLPMVLDFAAKLRENDQLDEAMVLYQRLQQIPGVPMRREAVLWSAYGNVQSGRTASARIFIEEVGAIERDERIFSLKKLIEGLIHLEREEPEYTEAMQEISQGVIYSDIRYDWMPELLYTTGICYEALGRPQVARQVYGQVTLFYPQTRWAEKCREAIAKLPEAEEIQRDESVVEEVERGY